MPNSVLRGVRAVMESSVRVRAGGGHTSPTTIAGSSSGGGLGMARSNAFVGLLQQFLQLRHPCVPLGSNG